MADKTDSVLAFRVNETVFGIRLSDIKEMIQMPAAGLLRAPAFPRCVLGIMNVRGRIAPVVNTWLCLDEREPDDMRNRVVCLCEREGELAGFVMDEVMNTVDNFDEFEEMPDDEGGNRLCAVVFRDVNGVKTGLITSGDLYEAARETAVRGLGI